ncbi:MAG TPA: hypothetical protein VGV38_09170 [Pyrinomonadaceae bacterium]|nr:hypothetical protein [Pyrinomonadaceae bacterium]
MLMRLAVALTTALVLIVFGVFWMFVMLIGMNGFDEATGIKGLIASAVLVIVTAVISSIISGGLAHLLQTRSGISPWLVGPLTVVSVTAVSIIFIFVSGSILISVIYDATRPAPPPAVNRRGAGR